MYRQDPHAVSRPVGDTILVIPLKRSEGRLEDNMLLLEGVAARIWSLLPCTIDELHRSILDEYEVEGDALRADLDAFLEELSSFQAVTVDGT